MTADTIGGVWTYATELARFLGSSGQEVTLATMGRPLNEDQRCEAAQIPLLRLEESRFKLEWMDDPWKDTARAGEWLLKVEQNFHPDVVHVNGYVHAALPWRAPVLAVAHSCVLSWWKAVKKEPAPAIWDHYRESVTAGLAAADLVVAPSRAAAAAVEEHYGPISAVRVIPNGRNPAMFGAGLKKPFVFSAGRLWDEGKNVAALTRVAPKLAWPVYVAGEASFENRPAPALENVKFLGRLAPSKLVPWLACAPIFVLPARYEPFGLTVLEAALSGCALVLGDIPSLRENWDGSACFVHPDDDAALESILNRLIADSAERSHLGACARARSLNLTHDRMAAAYQDIYSELACRSAVPEGAN